MTIALDIALAGNPNSGKTTLFNRLTGARQHVGNYPGVTVEKKEGRCRHHNRELNFIDLPGTYSLTAYTEEEVVARDFLINTRPRVINITDASNLERNLYLTLQLLEIGVPVIIALNMMDVAEKRGIQIDAEKLATRLRVPVVPIIARSGKGSTDLLEETIKNTGNYTGSELSISYGKDIDFALDEMEAIITEANLLTDVYPARWIALKYLENDQQVINKSKSENSQVANRLDEITGAVVKHLLTTMDTHPEAVIADYRYGYIKSVLLGVVSRSFSNDRLFISDKIDAVLTNRLLGPVIMLAILFGLYTFTFTFSEIPVGWFESFLGWFSGQASMALPDGYMKSLIVSGIIDGVGGVLGFVPIIAFMFFGIAVLEDSGYLARVAYMMDRVLRVFGLHGSSVMSYIVSGGIAGGCAVPGVMAARTLRSRNERLATILTAPFMNCGAKLPILALLTAAFFQNRQSQMMFILTLVGWIGAVLVAKLLRVTIIKGESTPFVMELPPYRMPTFQGLLIHTWERTWQYIKKAGTVILAISVLIWAMMTFPELPGSQRNIFETERQAIFAGYGQEIKDQVADANAEDTLSVPAAQLKEALVAIDNKEAEKALKYSIAGRIGTALEGVSQYAGFDWRTNIALVGGFAAKEVIVATLGTAYSLGDVDAEDAGSLSDTLAKAPGWNKIAGLAVILFVMFYAPCFVTVVCISRETGSWKWGLFSMVFNTIFAFILAVTVYQVGMLFYGVQ